MPVRRKIFLSFIVPPLAFRPPSRGDHFTIIQAPDYSIKLCERTGFTPERRSERLVGRVGLRLWAKRDRLTGRDRVEEALRLGGLGAQLVAGLQAQLYFEGVDAVGVHVAGEQGAVSAL